MKEQRARRNPNRAYKTLVVVRDGTYWYRHRIAGTTYTMSLDIRVGQSRERALERARWLELGIHLHRTEGGAA